MKSLIVLFLSFLFINASDAKELNKPEIIPLVTKNCVSESPEGRCRFYELTYSAMGASCTEDCVEKDSFGGCRIYNKCRYDGPSQCFEKSLCSLVDELHFCKKWDLIPVCAY